MLEAENGEIDALGMLNGEKGTNGDTALFLSSK